MRSSADVLLSLLNEILDFSRLEAGKLELESTPFNLRRICDQTLKALAVRGGGQPVLSRDDPARFAGWQSGRLNYASAPLDTVASDLSRSLGTPLRVDPDVRGLAFTGTIRIEGDQGATLSDFAATLGLQARHEGNGWVIEPHVRAPL